MIRQLLIIAGVGLCFTAQAQTRQFEKTTHQLQKSDAKIERLSEESFVVAKRNDGSNTASMRKAGSATVQWKRPAGHFWCTGFIPEYNQVGYPFTPIVLRPWTEYTFENLSTVAGTPSWAYEFVDTEAMQFADGTSTDQNFSFSYDYPNVVLVSPQLSYGASIPYPTMYNGEEVCTSQNGQQYTVDVAIGESFESLYGVHNAVSSHYWGAFTREPYARGGLASYTGADPYEDAEKGFWFGTNNDGINAMATRFEKPDQPYLLNAVYWYYQFQGEIPENIPLQAYVFKTENDAAIQEINNSQGGTSSIEMLEIGELIAVAQSFIPKGVGTETDFENAVKFEFVERNPVTGAENAVSLEIEDDITIVVVGFNAFLGNTEAFVTSCLSTDTYDEGYGNLGFLGSLDVNENGEISYWMPALKNFFQNPLPNTTLGVLADVSYPWLTPYFVNQPDEVKLPNEGTTTQEVQGLEYQLALLSTSETSDFEITYDGEDECDWLQVIDVYDDYQENRDGEEEFTGLTILEFQADPNPDDIDRTCVVKISIPAASFTIKFYQGSNNNAVEIVGAEGNEIYYDLGGRRVANPEKGIYIKKNGNKAEKVLF